MDKITVKHISENEIQEKGIRTWSTWSCDKSVFPQGLKCTWKVKQAVYKHFLFG